MADSAPLTGRARRTQVIRRRATAAGVGVLLGAFALVGVTTSLPADDSSAASTASPTPTVRAPAQSRQAAATAPRRVRTRQS
jgi:hypothetical protein